jgi:hypothetical protein
MIMVFGNLHRYVQCWPATVGREAAPRQTGRGLFEYLQNKPFCRMFPHFLMIPLFYYYGFCGIQAVNVQGDSLFNRGATISLAI